MSQDDKKSKPAWQRVGEAAMALSLGLMAVLVFTNVVLRYFFNSSVTESEELSRLLFVWMVFLGTTVAYPLGAHMAFTSLLLPLREKPFALGVMTRVIHSLVLLASVLVAWGAWQQVTVGWETVSPVVGYPAALVPLPAFLSCTAIAVMALVKLVCGSAIGFGHEIEVE
jgi:TRAP-type transport system small permease protein